MATALANAIKERRQHISDKSEDGGREWMGWREGGREDEEGGRVGGEEGGRGWVDGKEGGKGEGWMGRREGEEGRREGGRRVGRGSGMRRVVWKEGGMGEWNGEGRRNASEKGRGGGTEEQKEVYSSTPRGFVGIH